MKEYQKREWLIQRFCGSLLSGIGHACSRCFSHAEVGHGTLFLIDVFDSMIAKFGINGTSGSIS